MALLILTPAATELLDHEIMPTKVAEGGYVMLNQFAMKTTGSAYKTTGPEIWNDTEGTVTHFIAAMGTTGTIIGTKLFKRKESSNSNCGRSTQRWISNTRN
jgi:cysteine synthase B